MIERFSVLTEAECQTVQMTVHALREHWTQRHPLAPFYTLGAPSYLDARRDGAAAYYERARACNPLLQQNLAWLYARLAEPLSTALHGPVCFDERFGLPGFHIFLSSLIFELPVACIHCDLQYQLLDWSTLSAPDFTQPISFTLAIKLPRSGGGLDVWHLQHDEMMQRPRSEWGALFQSCEKSYETYIEGNLILHSGHLVHRIAAGKNLEDGDDRITLQGHGINCGGNWYIYW